jgi:hypothetical protein
MSCTFVSLAKELGIDRKYGFDQFEKRAVYHEDNSERGYHLSSEAILLAEPHAGKLADKKLAKWIKDRGAVIRDIRARKAEREVAEANAKILREREESKRREEAAKAEDDKLRAKVRASSPNLSEADIEAILPRIRQEEAIQKIKSQMIAERKAELSKW